MLGQQPSDMYGVLPGLSLPNHIRHLVTSNASTDAQAGSAASLAC